NEYFLNNPEMMLGEPSLEGSMYGDTLEFTLKPTGDLPSQMAEAIRRLPAGVMGRASLGARPPRRAKAVAEVSAGGATNAPDGTVLVREGQVWMADGGQLTQPAWAKQGAKAARAKSYVRVRDDLKEL